MIINAVAFDRPGIVSDLTGIVMDHGGNVGESQASRLGEHYFCLAMVVTVDDIEGLTSRLGSLQDMNATLFKTKSEIDTPPPAAACKWQVARLHEGIHAGLLTTGSYHFSFVFTDSAQFRLEGADNPGIVHTITKALVKHGLSIESLSTDQEVAPHGGTTLFQMTGTASAAAPLAAGFDPQFIKDELATLGDSLNCDVSIEDIKA